MVPMVPNGNGSKGITFITLGHRGVPIDEFNNFDTWKTLIFYAGLEGMTRQD